MPLPDAFALRGKVAVVTGAGGGIGGAIARTFADAGAKVACLDLRAPEAVAAAIREAGGEALAFACDVTDEVHTLAIAAEIGAAWGGAHVLVNGASNDDPTGTVLEIGLADWNRLFAVQVTGAYLMSRAILPLMIAGGGGSVIHIASQLGHVGAAGRPGYCAAKGALLQLARAMAIDHAVAGIRVNSLSPGAIETGRMILRHGDMESARAYNAPKHLLGRIGQPVEIARAALFLASDASSFMTGADLLVDGGYTTP
ncbi:SDR family oxidoreductase [Enterovirga sp. DB1703]|uniref:SDR family oxidoreductase n=1 Tax=Enterovirga aerilata TaxID=2730920 RepID=A0A849ICN1_9HYPH|nr:SDR family oxidoreductase [Enterovirga sp. DB1703]